MTRIKYSLYGGLGEWRSYSGGDKMLEISLPDVCSGALSLGHLSYPIEDGRCLVNTSLHSDGIYPIKINTGTCIYELEPLKIERGRARPIPTEDGTVRRLLERVELLERQLEQMNEATREIEKRLGNPLALF